MPELKSCPFCGGTEWFYEGKKPDGSKTQESKDGRIHKI